MLIHLLDWDKPFDSIMGVSFEIKSVCLTNTRRYAAAYQDDMARLSEFLWYQAKLKRVGSSAAFDLLAFRFPEDVRFLENVGISKAKPWPNDISEDFWEGGSIPSPIIEDTGAPKRTLEEKAKHASGGQTEYMLYEITVGEPSGAEVRILCDENFLQIETPGGIFQPITKALPYWKMADLEF